MSPENESGGSPVRCRVVLHNNFGLVEAKIAHLGHKINYNDLNADSATKCHKLELLPDNVTNFK